MKLPEWYLLLELFNHASHARLRYCVYQVGIKIRAKRVDASPICLEARFMSTCRPNILAQSKAYLPRSISSVPKNGDVPSLSSEKAQQSFLLGSQSGRVVGYAGLGYSDPFSAQSLPRWPIMALYRPAFEYIATRAKLQSSPSDFQDQQGKLLMS